MIYWMTYHIRARIYIYMYIFKPSAEPKLAGSTLWEAEFIS